MTSETFTGITTGRWEAIQQSCAKAMGVDLSAAKGAGVSHGIHFSWCYGGDVLAVCITHVPWYLGMSEQNVLDRFAAWINGTQTS